MSGKRNSCEREPGDWSRKPWYLNPECAIIGWGADIKVDTGADRARRISNLHDRDWKNAGGCFFMCIGETDDCWVDAVCCSLRYWANSKRWGKATWKNNSKKCWIYVGTESKKLVWFCHDSGEYKGKVGRKNICTRRDLEEMNREPILARPLYSLWLVTKSINCVELHATWPHVLQCDKMGELTGLLIYKSGRFSR